MFFAVGIGTALAARFFGSKKKAAEKRAAAFCAELAPLAAPVAERNRADLDAVQSLKGCGKNTAVIAYPLGVLEGHELALEFKNDGKGFAYTGARVR